MTTKNKFDFGNLTPEIREAVAYVRKIGKSNPDPTVRQQAEDIIYLEFGRRLRIVQQRYCDHQCDQVDFVTLCFRMACDLIPNFDFEKKARGRPRKGLEKSDNTEGKLSKVGTPKLVLLIQNKVSESNCSIKVACVWLRKQKGIYYAEYRNATAKTLETRYHELAHYLDIKEKKMRCPGCGYLVGLDHFPPPTTAA